MPDAWAEKLSCAIQCNRCDRQLAPTEPRILSVYDHEAICTGCKDDEEKRDDYEKISKIAEEISAFFMVDMAHLAGLVAAKVIPSPVPHCHFVTFTCYKTMMGGRGGVILCKEVYGKKIDKAVFPVVLNVDANNVAAVDAPRFSACRPRIIECDPVGLGCAYDCQRQQDL